MTTIFKRIKALWAKVPASVRKEIHSAVVTFSSVFLATAAYQVDTVGVDFTRDALTALALTAFRAAIKAAYKTLFVETEQDK